MIYITLVRERRRRRTAVAMAIFAMLFACARTDRGALPTATVPTAPAQTTTTDPYAVPPVIDVAYISRVIAGLDQIKGDVVRMIVKTQTIPREAYDRLRAIYENDGVLDRELDSLSRDLARGLSGYRTDPGNKRTEVREVIAASPSCIFVRVERDYSSIGLRGTTSSTEWIALLPLNLSRDPGFYNVTKWAYQYEGFTAEGNRPVRDPCVA